MPILPRKIGPYTLIRHLGSDVFEEEFLGFLDSPAGKRATIREIVFEPSATDAATSRLEELSSLAHPNTVRICDFHFAKSHLYVAEDRAGLVSLDEVIGWLKRHKRRISPAVFLHLAIGACRGLGAIHDCPSASDTPLHGGLRPRTLFIGPSGDLQIGRYPLDGSAQLSSTNSVSNDVSLLGYLAPEQTTATQSVQPSTDIFSLAAILFEIWTLHPIFLTQSVFQTLQRIRTGQLTTQLSEVRDSFPQLDQVFYRALSLNPRHRYQHAFVMKEDLKALQAGLDFANIKAEVSELLEPIVDEAMSRHNTQEADLLDTESSLHSDLLIQELPLATIVPEEDNTDLDIVPLQLPDFEAIETDSITKDDSSDFDEDTAALLRDLSLQRRAEGAADPAELKIADEIDESFTPVELPYPQEEHTTPIERPCEDETTDTIRRDIPYIYESDDDEEATVIAAGGDTVPYPRPLPLGPRPTGSEDKTSPASNDDLALELPIGTQDAPKFLVSQGRISWITVLFVMLFLMLLCTGAGFVLFNAMNSQ